MVTFHKEVPHGGQQPTEVFPSYQPDPNLAAMRHCHGTKAPLMDHDGTLSFTYLYISVSEQWKIRILSNPWRF